MVTKSEPRREAACMITEGGKTYCIDPLEETLQIISKRWALLVIGILGNRDGVRFSEAKNTIPGISARGLSSVLTALQEQGLATRHVEGAKSPPAVSYTLTESGRALRRALVPLLQWADEMSPHATRLGHGTGGEEPG